MTAVDHKLKALSVTVVVVDVLLIVLAIVELWMRDINSLVPVYLMNTSMDLVGMIVGFVMLICCYNDYQQVGIDQKYYRCLLEATILGLFADLTCWIVNEQPGLWQINLLINTIFFMTSPITVYFFWKYVTQLVNSQDSLIDKIERWVRALVIPLIVFCIPNVFGGYLFSIDTNGVYHRGFLYPLYMGLLLLVAFMIIALIVIKSKSLSRHQIVVLSIYLATPLPVLLMSVFVYGLSMNYIMLMVDTLVMYGVLNVEQGREKLAVQKELSLARRIQESMLPKMFSPATGKNEFELFASMTPTKEVGGDFYDFFMIDDDHLGLVIADVSDKGVPAAMCMMATKILIANNLKLGKSPKLAMSDANKSFCSHNDEDMFVTAWIGKLEISTGKLTCVNAGHEYPMIKHGDKAFAVFEDKHGKPIGWMDTSVYDEYEVMLSPGDIIFVYTDGVPEAKDKKGEMFGMDRTIAALDREAGAGCEGILQGVWNDVRVFVNEAEQFDDLTMLSVEYKGGSQ